MPSSYFTSAHTSPQESTPASSPPAADMEENKDNVSKKMLEEEEKLRVLREKEDKKLEEKMEKERQVDLKSGRDVLDKKFQQLEFLMNKSKLYATVMLAQMQRQEEEEKAQDEKTQGQSTKREKNAEKVAAESQRRATRASAANSNGTPAKIKGDATEAPKKGRGRPRKEDSKRGKISDFFKKEDLEKKTDQSNVADALKEAADEDNVKTSDIGFTNLKSARQPKLVTGGTMRSYQLEGLEWLLSLYENGINGILADEMGLGKTVQTIALLAHLWEMKSYGPFLIAAPLSTTSNWVEEFKKWTPSIPVVLYHGSKQDRAEIRRKKLRNPGTDQFPVVVTSYEICMNDRKYLTGFGWQFIIIDEGHRIKNLDCRLIRELQQYQSTNRLLITGTPLQNNLTELWSLLHFLLPTVFDKLSTFESWFDFSGLRDQNSYEQLLSEERQQYLVKSLHAVLKPFLLRRVKTDVESLMPKKREYILFAPLTPMQRELYQAILDGSSRSYLEEKAIERLSIGTPSGTSTPASSRSVSSMKRKALSSGVSTPNKSAKPSREATPSSFTRSGRRGRPRKNYEEVADSKYFAELQAQEEAPETEVEELDSSEEEERVRTATFEIAKRQLMQKKLGNPIMQLRLCCNSPYNFFNPFITTKTEGSETFATETEPDETIVTTSGKMLLLDRLLPELLKRGHKVLIFSQFTTTLDLISTYLDLRSHPHARIDGSVAQSVRQEQIHAFNIPNSSPTATNVFLLSTRAGGQGINLAAADTVILFDSDWNPQQDLQAMDRAHRIGQTRNVVVYRFATRGTVEQKLLESAEGKRRLEKLVIRKGGVRNSKGSKEQEKEHEVEELRRLLRRSDGERFDVRMEGGEGEKLLSEGELEILLDRSEEAYERAERGLDVGGDGRMFQAVGKREEGALMEGLKA
ncbi:SNF2 family helicase/ATPase-like protein PasG [Delitschia confertaspora ATCC 74209]|uniref:SNF2 family helicase/ATPase-like protein PasG n=1 Tax=Delitschia confertaspora ATCC 74209 TaxID=1513339 RepID=A0A9P4MLN3_9PLEO|nr:SNF2 family helicase/ATPase-like protein PasG [Delitschia confertaspora ATCC 74209]